MQDSPPAQPSSAPEAGSPQVAGRSVPSRLLGMRRCYLAAQARHRAIVVAAQLLYAAVFVGWLIYDHVWPAPDLLGLGLLGCSLVTTRLFGFLRDWAPLVLLTLVYVAFAGIDPGVVGRAHVQFPITVDRFLFFGRLPTTWLQAHLWTPPHLHPYDYLVAILYPLHFAVPLVLALVLWTWDRRAYWRFVAAFLLVCFAGLATYLLFPMAPPWWAGALHRIPPVQPILGSVHFGGSPHTIDLLGRYFRVNLVAAMPSIHAAFPVLVWLVAWEVWPKWGWATVLYPIGMSFTVIYLGEHYAIDCIAGWSYAAAAFSLIWQGEPLLRRLRQRREPALQIAQ